MIGDRRRRHAVTSPPPAPYTQPYTEIALAGQWADVQSAVAVTRRAAPVSVELSVANHTSASKTYELVPAMRDARWGIRTFELGRGRELARPRPRQRCRAGGCLHRLLVSVHETGARKRPSAP